MSAYKNAGVAKGQCWRKKVSIALTLGKVNITLGIYIYTSRASRQCEIRRIVDNPISARERGRDFIASSIFYVG